MRNPKTVASAALLLVLLLPPAAAAATESSPGTLEAVWQELVGQRGVLEEKDCGYVFTSSSPTQRGNATVKSVAADHVVIVEIRDQTTTEHVIPLHRVTLKRSTP